MCKPQYTLCACSCISLEVDKSQRYTAANVITVLWLLILEALPDITPVPHHPPDSFSFRFWKEKKLYGGLLLQ